MSKGGLITQCSVCAAAIVSLFVSWASAVPQERSGLRRPVIIIPGVTGSELVDRAGKKVWFSFRRNRADDLRLPMTSTVLSRNRDGLRAGDIIREVKLPILPDIEVYQTVIDALKARGYTEARWDKPRAEDSFYVFAYDWRRDNVESAHLLIRRMLAVKRKLRRPDLKFDIVAHSMGGLIARYAAMYGLSDLPPPGRTPIANWSGAPHIAKLLMFGTPNEGSMGAFEALIKGFPLVAGRRLPLVDDPRAEDVMSSPSVFQLLPHNGSARFLDAELRPVAVDLYDAQTWLRYRWGPIADPRFLAKLKDGARIALTNKEVKPVALRPDAPLDDRILAQTTYAQVMAYFSAALRRAKVFHAALSAPSSRAPLEFYAYGGNCEPTLEAVVLIRDEKAERWRTYFEARELKRADGSDITKDEVRAAMFVAGDGRVTQRSLLTIAEPGDKNGKAEARNGLFPLTSSFFTCTSHTKLFLDKPIQDSFLSALIVETQKQP
jgi:pimeloyl-ACP methyl ester carboxylesterase